MDNQLPNFLILGSAKCATTSLHFYLNQHPDIFMTAKKECHYFCNQDIAAGLYKAQYRPVPSLEDYQALFKGSADVNVRGESSPMYLFYEQTAERIYQVCPHIKMVAVLRNPADRAYSAYLHAVRDGLEELSFEQAIAAEPERMASGKFSATHAYHEFGFYYRKLKPYFDRFPREQLQVFLYEEVSSSMQRTLKDICRFLQVDADFAFDTRPKLNVSGIPKREWLDRFVRLASGDRLWARLFRKPFPKHAWIRIVKSVQYANYEKPEFSSDARQRTLATYAEDIEALSDLLGRDLAKFWGVRTSEHASVSGQG